MSRVNRSTTAGRVYLDLQRLARESRRPTDELLRTYVLERFLWRVGSSSYRDQLILKGGMLMAVLGERRPTADVDMLALDLSNDLESVASIVQEVLAVESKDGVGYVVDQMKVSTIRDDDVYPGVRVSVPATIDRARAVLRVDVNVGDPVTPAPVTVEYPALLDGSFEVVGYPFETVLAEKIVTMIDRGELNTRERDFADVILLTRRLSVDGDVLAEAIDATIEHRGSQRRAVGPALGQLGELRQSNWAKYLASSGLEGSLPVSFDEAVNAVLAFADPVIAGGVSGKAWSPSARSWK